MERTRDYPDATMKCAGCGVLVESRALLAKAEDHIPYECSVCLRVFCWPCFKEHFCAKFMFAQVRMIG